MMEHSCVLLLSSMEVRCCSMHLCGPKSVCHTLLMKLNATQKRAPYYLRGKLVCLQSKRGSYVITGVYHPG